MTLRLAPTAFLAATLLIGTAAPTSADETPWAGASSGAVATLAAVPVIPDWPVYHHDRARTGYDPLFLSQRGTLVHHWTRALDGAVYAEPLVVGGRLIAATEGDSVYALDPATGHVLWRHHLGTPVPLSSLPCGDIDPLGIMSTPAYDPISGSLFVAAEVSGPRHVLFALDPATGAARWSQGLDLAGEDPSAHQQRAALAVGNGYVYVGLGGLFGDCGSYVGEVMGVPTSHRGAMISYRVPVRREGGVWASGGPVLDAAGQLYVSVGNGSSTTTYDGSESVLELSAGLHLLSRFAPSTWAADNATDADLGSLSPVLLPGGLVFISGKSGTGYVLRQGALGGIGGQVAFAKVCAAFGGAAQVGSTVYVPCAGGLRKVRIAPDGSIHLGWRSGSGATGPPVVGGGAVWSLDIGSGELFALSPATGAVLARIGLGAVPHFASPTLWNGRVYVGTMRGVRAVRTAP